MRQWQSIFNYGPCLVFLNINLFYKRLVILGCCGHPAVMQFQDKFSSSRQVNSPKNQNFEYVVSGKVLANFACCFFVLISRIYLNFATTRPREKSEDLMGMPLAIHLGRSCWCSFSRSQTDSRDFKVIPVFVIRLVFWIKGELYRESKRIVVINSRNYSL